jgi:hypothetical protein
LRVEFTDYNDGLYAFQWYFQDVAIPNAIDPTYTKKNVTALDDGIYSVKVTSLNGCGEATMAVRVSVGGSAIDEYNNPSFRIVDVRPNPVSDNAVLTYILPEALNVKLSVLDVTGKNVIDLYYGMSSEGENVLNLSNKLSSLSSGTYFILLESNVRKATHKITLKR